MVLCSVASGRQYITVNGVATWLDKVQGEVQHGTVLGKFFTTRFKYPLHGHAVYWNLPDVQVAVFATSMHPVLKC